MENTYDIFEDLKGRVISMVTRSFDDAEDFEFFVDTANIISQIEEELETSKKDLAYWKTKALENFHEKNELKKKLEEVNKLLNNKES